MYICMYVIYISCTCRVENKELTESHHVPSDDRRPMDEVRSAYVTMKMSDMYLSEREVVYV